MSVSKQYLARAVEMQRAGKIASDPLQQQQYRDLAAAWLDVAEAVQRLERQADQRTSREKALP